MRLAILLALLCGSAVADPVIVSEDHQTPNLGGGAYAGSGCDDISGGYGLESKIWPTPYFGYARVSPGSHCPLQTSTVSFFDENHDFLWKGADAINTSGDGLSYFDTDATLSRTDVVVPVPVMCAARYMRSTIRFYDTEMNVIYTWTVELDRTDAWGTVLTCPYE